MAEKVCFRVRQTRSVRQETQDVNSTLAKRLKLDWLRVVRLLPSAYEG